MNLDSNPIRKKYSLLSGLEKQALKTEIYKSVTECKIRRARNRIMFLVMASLAIYIVFYSKNDFKTSMSEYINSTKSFSQSKINEVVLIHDDKDKFKFSTQGTNTHYPNSEEEVNIGGREEINQKNNKNDLSVFNTLLINIKVL